MANGTNGSFGEDNSVQRAEEDARQPSPRAGGRSAGPDARRAQRGHKDRDVLDQGESSEVDIQEDIELALIQMKSETLNKIDAALRRLGRGQLRRLLRVR